jgi:hypothetical protein
VQRLRKTFIFSAAWMKKRDALPRAASSSEPRAGRQSASGGLTDCRRHGQNMSESDCRQTELHVALRRPAQYVLIRSETIWRSSGGMNNRVGAGHLSARPVLANADECSFNRPFPHPAGQCQGQSPVRSDDPAPVPECCGGFQQSQTRSVRRPA